MSIFYSVEIIVPFSWVQLYRWKQLVSTDTKDCCIWNRFNLCSPHVEFYLGARLSLAASTSQRAPWYFLSLYKGDVPRTSNTEKKSSICINTPGISFMLANYFYLQVKLLDIIYRYNKMHITVRVQFCFIFSYLFSS